LGHIEHSSNAIDNSGNPNRTYKTMASTAYSSTNVTTGSLSTRLSFYVNVDNAAVANQGYGKIMRKPRAESGGEFQTTGATGPTGTAGVTGPIGATGPTSGSSYINWENDLLRTDNSVTNSISPTLTTSLDVNNFVYEVIIEFYLTASPAYIGLGFNEVYSDVVYVERSISHTYGAYYDNGSNTSQLGLGFNTALFFIPGSGECKFIFLLSPHRTFRNAGQGSSVQNLGVLAQGEFTYMERVIDNTSSPTKMSTYSFAKYALGTPLIDVTQSTAALSNINYISLWCSSNITAIKNYRIRTRKYANISRD
jgi:hypothetical protein